MDCGVNLTSDELLTLRHKRGLGLEYGEWNDSGRTGIVPANMSVVEPGSPCHPYGDYTQFHQTPVSCLPTDLSIDVVDSIIGPESVPAIADFFVC